MWHAAIFCPPNCMGLRHSLEFPNNNKDNPGHNRNPQGHPHDWRSALSFLNSIPAICIPSHPEVANFDFQEQSLPSIHELHNKWCFHGFEDSRPILL